MFYQLTHHEEGKSLLAYIPFKVSSVSECGWSLLCPAKLNSHLNEALGHLTSTHSPKTRVTQHTTCFQSSSNHCAVGGSSKQSWYFLSCCLGTLTGI